MFECDATAVVLSCQILVEEVYPFAALLVLAAPGEIIIVLVDADHLIRVHQDEEAARVKEGIVWIVELYSFEDKANSVRADCMRGDVQLYDF